MILSISLLAFLAIALSLDNYLFARSSEGNYASEIDHSAPPGGSGAIAEINLQAQRNPLSRMKRNELSETIERPLFSATRRPFIRRPQPVLRPRIIQPSRPTKVSYKLLGVLISEGRSVALIRDLVDGKNIRVRQGDDVQGWNIGEVGPSRVFLNKRGEKTIVLNLFAK